LGCNGNLYHVMISQVPKCNCSESLKGDFCQHILFVLCRVFKIDTNSPIIYQQTLLKSELQQIFARAPPDPSALIKTKLLQREYLTLSGKVNNENKEEEKIKQKPIHEQGECSICCEVFNDKEPIVWCQALCGWNFHQDCLSQWSRLLTNGEEISCPLCRAPWVENKQKEEKSASTIPNLKQSSSSLLSDESSPNSEPDSNYELGKKHGGTQSRDC